MSDQATPPGRTGRGKVRHSGEAPPSERQPEDETSVDQGEAEPAVTAGIYFAKAPNRDVWHGYDDEDVSVGTVYHNGTEWKVRVNRNDLPAKFGSAASGRSFLMGYWLGGNHVRESMPQFRTIEGSAQRATNGEQAQIEGTTDSDKSSQD